MVRDVFVEEIVKKRMTPVDLLIMLGIGVLSAVLAVVFLFIGMVVPFCWVLSGLSLYFGYFFITRRSVEFEYSLTNDKFDVDKIIAKRTRKRLIASSCQNFDDFGQYVPDEHSQKQYEKKIFACDSRQADNLWYFVARGSNSGNTLVVFNGTERMLEGIKSQIPRHRLQEWFDQQ